MFEPLLRAFVPFYGRWMMRRHFDGLWVRGLDEARAHAARGPVIFAVNHLSWWDGIFMLTLAPRLGVDNRFLVDASSVDKLGYLEVFGAIAVDRSSLTGPIEGMEAAAGWLDRPQRSVWLYPQGRYRPAHLRPLGLHGGLRIVQRQSGAVVIPVAVQFGWFLAHLPAAGIVFGDPVAPGRDLMARLEEALVDQLDELDRFFDADAPSGPFVAEVPTPVRPIEEGWASRVALWLRGVYRRVRARLFGPTSRASGDEKIRAFGRPARTMRGDVAMEPTDGERSDGNFSDESTPGGR